MSMRSCVNPSELTEGDLAAYADLVHPADTPHSVDSVSLTDASLIQRVEKHLVHCSYCAAQVDRYRRTAVLLHAALYRASCPAPERLALYQLYLLPARERLTVARHVRECPHCQRELVELARDGNQPSLLDRLRQAVSGIEAVLLPAPSPQALGVRGAAPSAQRYHVEGLDVLVMVQPGHSKGHRTVRGRLLPETQTDPPEWGSEVWLIEGEQLWAAPVETRGTFCFEDVEPGVYDINLEWRGQVVRIRGIEVG